MQCQHVSPIPIPTGSGKRSPKHTRTLEYSKLSGDGSYDGVTANPDDTCDDEEAAEGLAATVGDPESGLGDDSAMVSSSSIAMAFTERPSLFSAPDCTPVVSLRHWFRLSSVTVDGDSAPEDDPGDSPRCPLASRSRRCERSSSDLRSVSGGQMALLSGIALLLVV